MIQDGVGVSHEKPEGYGERKDMRRLVNPTERIKIPSELITEEVQKTLSDLAAALGEEEMIRSMLSAVNGINRETYEIIKEDYRTAFNASREIKAKISQFVMEHYQSKDDSLSWSFSGDSWSITVYTRE